MRRDFELDENLTEPIDRYEEFRERVQALRYEERLFKQDEKVVVSHLATAQAVGSTAVSTQATPE
jgi:hypothetical protein